MHSARSESDHIYSYFCLHYFELKKNLKRWSKPLTDCVCMLKMYYYTWMVKVPSWLTNICPCVVPANINSWLPSLVQNTDGGGLPVASQSNLAMPFMPTLWSLGFTRKLGCAAKIGWEFFFVKCLFTEFLGFIRVSKMGNETFVLWDFHLSNILFLILGTGLDF